MSNFFSGEHFATTETFCPLNSVTAVLNETNVWGNILAAEAPNRLKWDFTDTSCWFPLFNSSAQAPNLQSIQPTQLNLQKPDSRAASALVDKVDKRVRTTLSNLRKRMKLTTPINFGGSGVLRKLLPSLEASRGGLTGGRNMTTDHLTELKRISASHKVA